MNLAAFRDPAEARRLVDAVRRLVTRPWVLMEVCGGQTHAILRHGLDQVLPPEIELVHGPGCPVCVTPLEMIDRALALAARPEVVFCTFGDMVRVPGSASDFARSRAAGADVRIVYSPLDAVKLARQRPNRQVIFFAIGFETTAPAHAMAARVARNWGLTNFTMLVSLVRVPPAIEAVLSSPGNRVQAFLAAGHVCAVMGTDEYVPLAERHRAPIVVTGFEPLDLLVGIHRAVSQLEAGEARVENAYPRVVADQGNPEARRLVAEVFEETDRAWRGLGVIPRSGWKLAGQYRAFDAEVRFPIQEIVTREPAECRSGDVLRGLIKPPECAAFGARCTPATPLGAPMVSAEGACAAYHQFHRLNISVS